MSKRLTVAERREIFNTLVSTQDEVHNVSKSKELVTKRFGITEYQLRQIEDEGIEREWLEEASERESVGA